MDGSRFTAMGDVPSSFTTSSSCEKTNPLIGTTSIATVTSAVFGFVGLLLLAVTLRLAVFALATNSPVVGFMVAASLSTDQVISWKVAFAGVISAVNFTLSPRWKGDAIEDLMVMVSTCFSTTVTFTSAFTPLPSCAVQTRVAVPSASAFIEPPAYNFTNCSPPSFLISHATLGLSACSGSILGLSTSDSWCTSVIGSIVILVTSCWVQE